MMHRTDGLPGCLELLVASQSERRENAFVSCRAWGPTPLPPQSICEIGDGIYAVSPELCLIRIAPRVSRLELLRYATDLMGIYARSHVKHTDLISRKPIMTKESLERYLLAAGSIPGSKAVRQILGWVRERSASPRETSMLLMLTLPTRLGGMGLPRFEANVEIPLSDEASLLTQKKCLIGDAVYLLAKVGTCDEDDMGPVLEYNSNTYHDTEEQLEFDFEKITALQRMGLTVIPVSTRQFEQFASFEQIVERVRQLVGQREKWASGRRGVIRARRSATHATLLALERKQRKAPSLVNTARWQLLLPMLHNWRMYEPFLA